MEKLSDDYYLEHFRHLIDDVSERYPSLLSAAEREYITRIRALPPDALRLYVRLVNRKGPFFRLDKLRYEAIACVGMAARALVERGLAQMPVARFSSTCLQQSTALLACFTTEDFAAQFPSHKPLLKTRVAWHEWIRAEAQWQTLLAHPDLMALWPEEPWGFLKFLFFGETNAGLSDFVVHALGHIRGEAVTASQLQPRFHTRAQVEDSYRMERHYGTFRFLRERLPALALLKWWEAAAPSRGALHPDARVRFDRLVGRLGQRLEREKADAQALQLYATAHAHPARERRARLLYKTGRRDDAITLCSEMRDAPSHPEEAYAARQLLRRWVEKTRASEAGAMLATSETVQLARPDGQVSVEEALLHHFAESGWHGLHAENWLWNAALGLLLWDIIYDPDYGGFHHAMQLVPHDWGTPAFFRTRAPAIEARLEWLATPERAMEHMRDIFVRKRGVHNPFTGWHDDLIPTLETLITRLPTAGAQAIFRRMAQDTKNARHGFPDLFLWRESEYRFIEVKAPGDHLAGHQFEWIDFFRTIGICVGVVRVRWEEKTENA